MVYRASAAGKLPADLPGHVRQADARRRGQLEPCAPRARKRQSLRRENVAGVPAHGAKARCENAGVGFEAPATLSGQGTAAAEESRPTRGGGLRPVQNRGVLARDRGRPSAPDLRQAARRGARVRLGADRYSRRPQFAPRCAGMVQERRQRHERSPVVLVRSRRATRRKLERSAGGGQCLVECRAAAPAMALLAGESVDGARPAGGSQCAAGAAIQ